MRSCFRRSTPGRAAFAVALVGMLGWSMPVDAGRTPRRSAPAPAVSDATRGAPPLWRVTRDGRTSYLFGTVHLPVDMETTLGPEGQAALDASTRVYVEVDLMAPGVVEEIGRLTIGRAELPPGQSLRGLISPTAWTRLVALAKGHVPADALDRMEPWFASVGVLPVLIIRDQGELPEPLRPGVPLDAVIASRAKARGNRVVPLETPHEAIQAFVSAGREDAVEMLEELILRPDWHRQDAIGLVDAYTANDDRRILKAFGRMRRKSPALTEHLLFRRNERWCERLDLWLGDGGLFVAAGAFHMFGERGLVALLRQRGYRVERVRPVPPAAGAPQPRRS
jgi:uncharacterized protein